MTGTDLEGAIAATPDDAPPFVGGAPLRASWAGDCARKIAYHLRGEPVTDELSAASQIAFAVGSAVHELVQDALLELHPLGVAEAEGCLVVSDEVTAIAPALAADFEETPVIGCHADFLYGQWSYGPTVVEIKTMQTFPFERAKEEGPQEHHVLQAGLNGLAQGAEQIELVYIDKAKGAIAVYTPKDWQKAASEEALRLAAIWESHRIGQLPAPIDEARRHWRCRYGCPFLATCKASA
jgi:hypothetical protein